MHASRLEEPTPLPLIVSKTPLKEGGFEEHEHIHHIFTAASSVAGYWVAIEFLRAVRAANTTDREMRGQAIRASKNSADFPGGYGTIIPIGGVSGTEFAG